MRVSESEEAMRESRIRRTKTVCTYCESAAVRCLDEGSTYLKVEPLDGPANGIHMRQGKFAWDISTARSD